MRLIKEIIGVQKIGSIQNNIVYYDGTFVSKLENSSRIISTTKRPSFYDDFIVIKLKETIEVYDSNLSKKIKVKYSDRASNGIGICHVTENSVIWSFFNTAIGKKDYYLSNDLNSQKILSAVNFTVIGSKIGVITYSRLRNPTHLRCTDIMAKATNFEYQCPDGKEIVRTSFLTCNNQLVFVETNQKIAEIICLDLDTGAEVWRGKGGLPRTFDKNNSRSVLFSYDRDERYPKQATYRIVDFKNHTIKSGKAHCDFKLSNVADISYLRTFNGDRMYFVDNQYSISGVSNAPKFGCFNIETKEVEFVHELPYKDHSSIDQIIYNEGKLFIRTTVEKLFVYEV